VEHTTGGASVPRSFFRHRVWAGEGDEAIFAAVWEMVELAEEAQGRKPALARPRNHNDRRVLERGGHQFGGKARKERVIGIVHAGLEAPSNSD
jgi:hypothetical protein